MQLTGGRSRRGKYRGPPGSRQLVADALRGCDDHEFVDFLRRCLDLDPQSRMTPAEALRHPWLSGRRYDRPQDTTTEERTGQRQHSQTTTTSATTTTTTSAGDRHRRVSSNNNVVDLHAKLPHITGTL